MGGIWLNSLFKESTVGVTNLLVEIIIDYLFKEWFLSQILVHCALKHWQDGLFERGLNVVFFLNPFDSLEAANKNFW